MLKILVVTRNHIVEIQDVCAALTQAVATGVEDVVVNSPQFIADMVSRSRGIPYVQTYYPALRAYKNIEGYMEEGQMLITVGTIDRRDLRSYSAIVGLRNDDIQDYDVFDEDFNTTNMETITLDEVDILFDNLEELIHFLRITINNYRTGKIK